MNESNHNPYTIPLSILISGILIAGAVMYAGDGGFAKPGNNLGANVGDSVPTPPEENGTLEAVSPLAATDHVLGNPSAPVKIIEYSDLECPFCARFHETLKQAMDEYGKDGKIAWVYRHFPLEQIHSSARLGATASECAARIGGTQAFWSFIDAVFSRQEEGLGDSFFSQVARDMGLDENAFSSCVSSGDYNGVIDANAENAIASGGRGTPFSIIIAKDGSKQVVNGAVPYATLKTQIEQALGK
ncbi:MAG: hypothetical protein A3J55_01870 [Candidatus Ryanbacteria bacterium RIFCSPHIGHO2_02_FULL_45_17b]|uniref:Thioredoxin domain-containing protein n=1 Tax=Candidatus Ryanbacteria bacterium RIFCSPHIGHO2_01_FULL_45_22 TaxID=1802114 RepID=A0A1G2G354_9BACT|nr:MAG: hypothetical protein A2719_04195 [Candidatus Ryanbacteria bacterium RIFCSPHIGHO2_01_FULL_45_22]OGZ47648.1 MAG: hypothetical protein A3J55_01870 [Candidatus Ryanbacteria bacterium RIFCSPHIGHO2_02_FULL_45_17b]